MEQNNNSFAALDQHLTFHVLECIPIRSLGTMSMDSKEIAEMVIAYILSGSYARRAALLLLDDDDNTRSVCHDLGLAIKRATFTYSVETRLQYLHQFFEKLTSKLTNLKKSSCVNIFKCIGEILSTFITGWHINERLEVFKSFCGVYNIAQEMQYFAADDPGEDTENEMLLREHLRYIFLDPCTSDVERATWFGFIAPHMGYTLMAKLLLLLYGPLGNQGQLDWNFALKPRSFRDHIDTYMKLGRIVGSFHNIPNWTRELSLEILHYVSDVADWPLHSLASLLFALSAFNMDLVFSYFIGLCHGCKTEVAAKLLTLVLANSPCFVRRSQATLEDIAGDDGALFSSSSASNLIIKVVNHPKLRSEETLRKEMKREVRHLNYLLADLRTSEDGGMAEEGNEDFRDWTTALGDYVSSSFNSHELF